MSRKPCTLEQVTDRQLERLYEALCRKIPAACRGKDWKALMALRPAIAVSLVEIADELNHRAAG